MKSDPRRCQDDPSQTLRWTPKTGQADKLGRIGWGTRGMSEHRKRYSAEFKAKVALEAIRGELTVAQLVAKHGVHQTLINGWKKQAMEGLAGVFSGRTEAVEAGRAEEVEKLHAKIGQLVVERDFLRRASGR
jgi:transposase